MKAKFGAIVVDGRGKIGGHVFSKNRGGAYMRTKVTPSNPQTAFQNAVRNRITSLSQGWRGLTEVQRAAWNGAASNFTSTDIFGDIKKPTGLNLFVKLNANLLSIGEAVINVPPLPSEVSPMLLVDAVVQVGLAVFDLTFDPTPVAVDTSVIVSVTPQVSAGKNFLKNEFRELQVLAAGAVSGQDIKAAYESRFGALVAGLKIGLALTPVNAVTGQKGQTITNTVIVAA